MKRLVISTITAWSAFLLMHGYYFFFGKWGTTTREFTGEKSSSHDTQTVEITKRDMSSVADSVFDPALIPELKDVEIPPTAGPSPTHRMHRHFVIIAVWLLVPIVIIACRRQNVLKKSSVML